MDKILVVGAIGQIGSELTMSLRQIYGNDNVIASNVKVDDSRLTPTAMRVIESGPFEYFDILNRQYMFQVCKKYNINMIVDLAAILSAVGEQHPMLAWDININGMINVFEIARELKMKRVMVPSSIAVFGPGTPLDCAPQETVLKPTTMYGVTKVVGELVGDYYVNKFGMDIRGLRYPGIISYETLPGGGTTDYAVAIYFDAVKYGKYTCFVSEDTRLPMMYMPDCLKATTDLFQADFNKLKHHCDFNVAAMSFTAGELAASIKKYMPSFEIEYKPDYRQKIADSWPDSLDDTAAREEWGWKPSYDLDAMTQDMLKNIKIKAEKCEI